MWRPKLFKFVLILANEITCPSMTDHCHGMFCWEVRKWWNGNFYYCIKESQTKNCRKEKIIENCNCLKMLHSQGKENILAWSLADSKQELVNIIFHQMEVRVASCQVCLNWMLTVRTEGNSTPRSVLQDVSNKMKIVCTSSAKVVMLIQLEKLCKVTMKKLLLV